jgi:probable F420-dependent oxidoreductase
MKFGMSIIVRGPDCGRQTFEAMAAKAEETGLDTLWASDHLVIPALKTSRYPGRADGAMPDTWVHAYYQPFSVLNYMAALTQTVRLGMSVLILPMRNPIEVAAQVAELDCLSGGRVDFGVGIGWFREEFEALGYDFTTRGKRTDEGLDAIKALWSDQAATFDGAFYRFEDTRLSPKPAQTPHPPIYVGGNSPAAMRRTARHGDVWHPLKLKPEQLVETRPELDAYLDAVGRPAASVTMALKVAITFQDGPPGEGQDLTEGRPQDIADAIRRYEDVGTDEICLDIRTDSAAAALDAMDRFAGEVRPKL